MRPWFSVSGTRWTRCTPDFELHAGENALAGYARHDFLVAARIGVARRKNLDFPPLHVGIALIHAEKIGREQRRLLAACPCPNLDNRAFVVRRILRQKHDLQIVLKLVDARHDGFKLLTGEFEHVGLGRRIFDHLPEVVAFVLRALKGLDGGHERIELRKLFRELYEGLVIDPGGKLRLNRFPMADETIKFLFWNRCHRFCSAALRESVPAQRDVKCQCFLSGQILRVLAGSSSCSGR